MKRAPVNDLAYHLIFFNKINLVCVLPERNEFWNSYLYCREEILLFCVSWNNDFLGKYTPCLGLEFVRGGYLLMRERIPSCTSKRTRDRITDFCILLLPCLLPHLGIVGCQLAFSWARDRRLLSSLVRATECRMLGLLLSSHPGCVLLHTRDNKACRSLIFQHAEQD